jgi:hypothetical protein
MKKLLTIAFAMLLGASLSFAQAAAGTDKPATEKAASGKKTKKSGKKAGKKAKKDAAADTTKK